MKLFDLLRGKSRSRKAAEGLACQELVEIITDYLEGALPPEDRVRFEAHIAGCGNCTAYLEQMRRTIAAVGRLKEEDIPLSARAPLLEAFRTWKQRQVSGT